MYLIIAKVICIFTAVYDYRMISIIKKPVEAEIKRNLFNWTSIIPPYILMLCYGGGFDHWLIHLVNFSWRVKFCA